MITRRAVVPVPRQQKAKEKAKPTRAAVWGVVDAAGMGPAQRGADGTTTSANRHIAIILHAAQGLSEISRNGMDQVTQNAARLVQISQISRCANMRVRAHGKTINARSRLVTTSTTRSNANIFVNGKTTNVRRAAADLLDADDGSQQTAQAATWKELMAAARFVQISQKN